MLELLLACQISQADINRQLIYQSLLMVDWAQTRDIAKKPEFEEKNFFLGENPSVGEVNTYFAALSLVQVGVTLMLAPENRAVWQYVSIGVAAGNVTRNHYYGVKLDFPW